MIADYLSVFNDTCVLFVKVSRVLDFFSGQLVLALILFSTLVLNMSFI